MALLRFNPLPSVSSTPAPPCATSLPIAVLPIPRSRLKTIDHPHSKCLTGTQFVPNMKKSARNLKASYAITDGGEAQLPEETKKEALTVEQQPLETKTQQLMEQKMKVKLAKKIRLRRKRLVRKRKLRKKDDGPLPR
ncbi:Endonuclease/exonuclease/phosphatase family protein isoform 1 [Hibiscus syriacus]|uniref:Endonuclease/exonuclease/phosphatase family protein isoform 1 n=1 Tax=Hibiscus syriacus TaxID=106335 RepID=A0A6A2Z0W8_HIBSY|nr:50S ribosomal protein 5, chloroplastic-like [Hibiscus syriacus]KAE8684775.1 Endonuclease/exonuclease/phosphatase family protein isoform 1 [Hibiscus syriacus]